MTTLELIRHPLALLSETLRGASENGGSRWIAWVVDIVVFSLAIPLIIGVVARIFSFRKDEDDAPRKLKAQYAAEGTERTFALRRENPSRNPLELPSPEPEPFIYPE